MNVSQSTELHFDVNRDAQTTAKLCEMTVTSQILEFEASAAPVIPEDVTTNDGGWLMSDSVFLIHSDELSGIPVRRSNTTNDTESKMPSAVSIVDDYSLPWKMGIDENTYDYVASNGRYREWKEIVRTLNSASASRKRGYHQRSVTSAGKGDVIDLPKMPSEPPPVAVNYGTVEVTDETEGCHLPTMVRTNCDPRPVMVDVAVQDGGDGAAAVVDGLPSVMSSRPPSREASRASSMVSVTAVRFKISRSAGEVICRSSDHSLYQIFS